MTYIKESKHSWDIALETNYGDTFKTEWAYITNLSSESDGRMRLTATGVPRQLAFKISPNDPWQYEI